MMARAVVDKAQSLVGHGYIYGAKGQVCSPEFRQQQAQQYPEQAENILGTGEKWDGKPVWDCAQLTRAAAKAGGVDLVSGATSQWNKTDWENYGPIDTLPPGDTALVFRRQNGSGTVMQHVGLALGDGTCVHARGTAYGVVRQNMSQYAWTHWGIPKWTEEGGLALSLDVIYQAKVVAQSGSTVNMRNEPGGRVLEKVPVGTTVDVLDETSGWARILYDNDVGYMQTAFLQKTAAPTDMVSLNISREAANELRNALAGVLG